MEKLGSFFSNTILTAFLLVLILGPVGIIGKISGTGPKIIRGVALGAKLNERGGTLSGLRAGEIKEISVTTFWGNQAQYKNALSLKNETEIARDYRIEILGVSGTAVEEQKIRLSFARNGQDTITLQPGETVGIDLDITAPEKDNLTRTQTTLKLAIWEN